MKSNRAFLLYPTKFARTNRTTSIFWMEGENGVEHRRIRTAADEFCHTNQNKFLAVISSVMPLQSMVLLRLERMNEGRLFLDMPGISL